MRKGLKTIYDIYYNYQMKEKLFIGIIAGIGGISMACGIQSIYNFYILPVIRHKEMMDKKIDGFDKRLKKIEKGANP